MPQNCREAKAGGHDWTVLFATWPESNMATVT